MASNSSAAMRLSNVSPTSFSRCRCSMKRLPDVVRGGRRSNSSPNLGEEKMLLFPLKKQIPTSGTLRPPNPLRSSVAYRRSYTPILRTRVNGPRQRRRRRRSSVAPILTCRVSCWCGTAVEYVPSSSVPSLLQGPPICGVCS